MRKPGVKVPDCTAAVKARTLKYIIQILRVKVFVMGTSCRAVQPQNEEFLFWGRVKVGGEVNKAPFSERGIL